MYSQTPESITKPAPQKRLPLLNQICNLHWRC